MKLIGKNSADHLRMILKLLPVLSTHSIRQLADSELTLRDRLAIEVST